MEISDQEYKALKDRINELEKAQGDLHRSEEELKLKAQLLDNSTDSIFLHDTDGNFIFVNEKAYADRGYTKEELLKMNLRSLDVPEYAKLIEPRIAQLRVTGETSFESAHYRKSGSIMPVEVHVRIVRVGGKDLILSAARDISERKMAEEKLKRELDELKQAKDELNRTDKMKTEFLSVVSHEMKEPLVPIMGYADLLLAEEVGPLNEKQKQFLVRLSKESDNLHEILESVLDVSRLESGKPIELSKKEISIPVMLEQTLETFKQQQEYSHIKIEVETEPNLPLLTADPIKLKRVLINLISNAMKYTPKGGLVKIRCAREADMMKFSIIDNGIGLAKENLQAIFGKFFQVESAQLQVKKGVGLGLTISREIVEAHGGNIWAESEGIGKGTALNFTIPMIS